jgi:hypothetical protein
MQKQYASHEVNTSIENLPFPFVYYPSLYGTFIAFAKDENSPPVFCECMKTSIEVYLYYKEFSNNYGIVDPLRKAHLNTYTFPKIIAEESLKHGKDTSWLRFEKGICHRCLKAIPHYYACHASFGSVIKQKFGWYVQETWHRLGLGYKNDRELSCFPELCPEDLLENIEKSNFYEKRYLDEYNRLIAISEGPQRNDIAPNENLFMKNVKQSEAEHFLLLKKKLGEVNTPIYKRLETITKQDFGLYPLNAKWINETILFKIVQRMFSDHQVLFHHKHELLQGLELDVYIPDLKLGFEYQGRQHYKASSYFGGDQKLLETKKRDRRKKYLCRKHDIKLVCIPYTEHLSEQNIEQILKRREII